MSAQAPSPDSFAGKAALQQRVLPRYRAPFLEMLAERCAGGLDIFAGQAEPEEGVLPAGPMSKARVWPASNIRLGRGKGALYWQRGFNEWLDKRRPDALIMEANPRIVSNYSGGAHMKRRFGPVIGWGLGALEWDAHWLVEKARRAVIKAFLARFDALVAYSAKGAEDYIRLGFPAHRVFVAPNSAAATGETMELDAARRRSVLANYGLSQERPGEHTAIFVGRLIRDKAVDDLLRAAALIKDKCALLIVGDGEERKRLEETAAQAGLRAAFTGDLRGEKLAECLAAADFFVLPGLGGLALQEAMSHGKPVIAASGDGTQLELAREGINGFNFTRGDVQSLAGLMSKLGSDPELTRRMGLASKRIIESDYNPEIMLSAFLAAMNAALAARRQR